MLSYVIIAVVVIAASCSSVLSGHNLPQKGSEREISSAEEEARRIINEAIKIAESKQRELLLEAKEEIHKSRTEYEREVKERRASSEAGKKTAAKGRESR